MALFCRQSFYTWLTISIPRVRRDTDGGFAYIAVAAITGSRQDRLRAAFLSLLPSELRLPPGHWISHLMSTRHRKRSCQSFGRPRAALLRGRPYATPCHEESSTRQSPSC